MTLLVNRPYFTHAVPFKAIVGRERCLQGKSRKTWNTHAKIAPNLVLAAFSDTRDQGGHFENMQYFIFASRSKQKELFLVK